MMIKDIFSLSAYEALEIDENPSGQKLKSSLYKLHRLIMNTSEMILDFISKDHFYFSGML